MSADTLSKRLVAKNKSYCSSSLFYIKSSIFNKKQQLSNEVYSVHNLGFGGSGNKIYVYDESGNITKIDILLDYAPKRSGYFSMVMDLPSRYIQTRGDDFVQSHFYKTFEYDDQNRLIQEQNFKVGEEGDELLETIKTFYVNQVFEIEEKEENTHYRFINEEGLLLQEVFENGGVYEYQYNSKGLLIKKSMKISRHQEQTEEYKYDEEGRCVFKLTRFIDWVTDRKWSETEKYEFNEKGQKIKMISFFDAHQSKTRPDNDVFHDYTYDEKNGNLIRITQKNSQGETLKVENYTYDEDGNLIKENKRDGESEKEDIINYNYIYF